MEKIKRLTPPQRVRLAEFRDRWTEIGLSTSPADRPRAEAAIRRSYELAGIAPPARIVWCGSPLSQGLTRAIILNRRVGASVGASVWASVWDSVGDSVGDSVYGAHDAGWIAFYAYMREVLGLALETEGLQGLTDLAQSAGWALPHEHICWVSERHQILERDDEGHLHCLTGPAVAYPDGWSIYAVHGVRVPPDVIEHPESITAPRIREERNAEIRRVMLDRFGAGRYLQEIGARQVHRDATGELYRAELVEDEPLVMVKVRNSTPEPDGSIKDYWLRVPPDVQTAREAVAWTFGMGKSEYAPAVET